MKHILTRKIQGSKRGNDNKRRNYVLYFLNNELILRQKYPFNPDKEKGYDAKSFFKEEFIHNGNMYQTRVNVDSLGERIVSYPLSKRKLEKHNLNPTEFVFIENGQPSHYMDNLVNYIKT